VTNTLAGTGGGTTPGFANPSGLPTGAPSCGAYADVTDCMNTTYHIAAYLTPSGAAVGKGYVKPGGCTPDAFYPGWLKGLNYLQWNSATSTITENAGLITKPCGV